MSARNTLLKSIVVILSGTIAMRIVRLLFNPLLVRVLGQSQFGTFASVMAMYAIVSLVSKVGLFDAVRKHVAEFELGSTEQGVLVANGVVLSVIYGVAGTAVLVVLTYLPLGLGRGNEVYLLLLGLAIIPHNLYSVFRGAFYGRQQEQVVEGVHVLREVLYVTCGLVLAVVGFGLAGVFVGYVLSTFLSAILTGWMVHRDFSMSSPQITDCFTRYTRKIARYGGAQAVGGVAAVLLYQTDVLLTNYFRTAAETGLYKAALIPTQFIWIIPSVIQMSLLQNTSGHWANGRTEEITTNVRNGLRYSFLALTLFGVGLYALSEEFLRLYFGAGFEGSVLPLEILIIGSFFLGLNRILAPVLQSTGWIVHSQTVSVVGLFANIVLNVLFIPRYGIVGAAVATSLSYVLIFVGGLLIWRRTEFGYLQRRTVLSLSVTFGAFALVYPPLVDAFVLGDVTSLIVFPVLGGSMFLGICLLTGAIKRSELAIVRSHLARIGNDRADREWLWRP
jgi:O-antigen/teichoic acid export membrane protein